MGISIYSVINKKEIVLIFHEKKRCFTPSAPTASLILLYDTRIELLTLHLAQQSSRRLLTKKDRREVDTHTHTQKGSQKVGHWGFTSIFFVWRFFVSVYTGIIHCMLSITPLFIQCTLAYTHTESEAHIDTTRFSIFIASYIPKIITKTGLLIQRQSASVAFMTSWQGDSWNRWAPFTKVCCLLPLAFTFLFCCNATKL